MLQGYQVTPVLNSYLRDTTLAAGIDWLHDRGAPRVILWTVAPNKAAQRVFRGLGFRDTMLEMTMELP